MKITNCTFNTSIYVNPVGLLLEGKPNIKDYIKNNFMQGDPVFDDIIEDVIMQLNEADEDAIRELWDEDEIENIMKYISVEESEIYLDWAETHDLMGDDLLSFVVPCKFDAEKYINDKVAEGNLTLTAEETLE